MNLDSRGAHSAYPIFFFWLGMLTWRIYGATSGRRRVRAMCLKCEGVCWRVEKRHRSSMVRGGACGIRWKCFHHQMVDQPVRSLKGLPVCCFGAWKLVFWASNSAAALERVNSVAGFFFDTSECVTSPMEFFPSLNDRSEDNLSVGGGLGPSRFLERRFRRKWWLSHTWWRMGSLTKHTRGAWERVEGPMTTIFQVFCRSSDDLSNDRGGYSMGCLEARVTRLTVLGGAWKLGNSPRSCQNSRKCGSHKRRQL